MSAARAAARLNLFAGLQSPTLLAAKRDEVAPVGVTTEHPDRTSEELPSLQLQPHFARAIHPQGGLATIRIYDHRKTRPRFPDVHDKNPPQLSPARVLRGRAAACAATLLTALGCGCRSRMFDSLLFRFAWSPASFLFRGKRARHGIAVLGLGACIFGHG